MAKEILAISEDYLQEVINVIRAGLEHLGEEVSPSVRENLENWCSEEEEYLIRLNQQ